MLANLDRRGLAMPGAMDLVADQLFGRRRFQSLMIVAIFTEESLAIEARLCEEETCCC
jgi:hypothetical protein